MCVLQKEYPTADALGKPKRQHWDIAVLKNPLACLPGKQPPYDYLCLAAVIEFGLNEAREHLEDDIDRLRHPGANVEQGYFVHLYRLTAPTVKLSGRTGRTHPPASAPRSEWLNCSRIRRSQATTASTMRAASTRPGCGTSPVAASPRSRAPTAQKLELCPIHDSCGSGPYAVGAYSSTRSSHSATKALKSVFCSTANTCPARSNIAKLARG